MGPKAAIVPPAAVVGHIAPPLPNMNEIKANELKPINERPKIILLNTNEMAFFVYNLFSHDISHDGHPANLGDDRFQKAIRREESQIVINEMSIPHSSSKTPDLLSSVPIKVAKPKLTSIEKAAAKVAKKMASDTEKAAAKAAKKLSVKKGGSGDDIYIDTPYEPYELNDSVNAIIGSVSSELIQKKMLFVSMDRLRNRDSNFMEWQTRTFIIIDIPNILAFYNNDVTKLPSTYPGYIYFNNSVVIPYDIKVSKSDGQNYSIEWVDFKTNSPFAIRLNTQVSGNNIENINFIIIYIFFLHLF